MPQLSEFKHTPLRKCVRMAFEFASTILRIARDGMEAFACDINDECALGGDVNTDDDPLTAAYDDD